MKLILFIGIPVVAVVAIGGFVLFSMSNSGQEGTENELESVAKEESANMSNGDSEQFLGTITSLLQRGKNATCTFAQTDTFGEMNGTVYIAGNNVRGDFTMTGTEFGDMEGHVIQDGEYGYQWNSLIAGGTKNKLENPNIFEAKDDDKALNYDQEVGFTCKSWNLDRSKFTPPSDIEFLDITQNIQQIQEGSQMMQGAQCAACDQAADPASRAECRQALGCS